MSLDVYLNLKGVQNLEEREVIFIRENGQTKEISREEWNKRFPNREPVVVEIPSDNECVYDANITHNLTEMADKAGIYEALWRPYLLHEDCKDWGEDDDAEDEFERSTTMYAKDIILFLESGLDKLKSRPEYFKQFNAPNGWGMYEHFVPFVENYLNACKEYPEAEIEVSR